MFRLFALPLIAAVTLHINAAVEIVVTPAGAGSSVPFLSNAADGALLMIWSEPAGDAQALRFARFASGQWSAARTITTSAKIAANWANGPAIAGARNGALLALWLETAAGGHHNVDAYVSVSRDGGATWSKPRVLHPGTKPGEYGFASVVGMEGGFGVAWLDGRYVKTEAEGGMALRYAVVGVDGAVAKDEILDERVCECCGTGMAMTPRGPVIAYRDREAGDVRDISLVTRSGNTWSKPRTVRRDGWKVKGCPVNGPQVDSNGSSSVVGWFTAADADPRAYVAFSSDGGATFGEPAKIDGGKPQGRVDVQMLRDGDAVATWIEGTGDAASIVMRRVSPRGVMGEVTPIAKTGAARGIGTPRIAVAGDRLYVAWTEPGAKKQVRVASVTVR